MSRFARRGPTRTATPSVFQTQTIIDATEREAHRSICPWLMEQSACLQQTDDAVHQTWIFMHRILSSLYFFFFLFCLLGWSKTYVFPRVTFSHSLSFTTSTQDNVPAGEDFYPESCSWYVRSQGRTKLKTWARNSEIKKPLKFKI